MIAEPVREGHATVSETVSAAERLATLARRASSDEEAADAIRRALEEMLT
jgi:hypothetical protein